MGKFCIKCGMVLQDEARYCNFCGADQFPAAPLKEETPAQAQPLRKADLIQTQPPKSILGRVAIITAAAVVVICTASYFLFFVGNETTKQAAATPASETTSGAAAVIADATDQPTVPPTTQPAPTVSKQTITVDMAYDSGEGTYTGEIKNGVPHGQGSFEMVKSDNDRVWSYEGQWENGKITGKGTLVSGALVYTGTFRDGLLNGSFKITDDGVLRYEGMCKNNKLQGKGKLYTGSGSLLFEGTFKNDMLVESAAEREKRGEAFQRQCENMDAQLYASCLEGNDVGRSVAVWGFTLGISEQKAQGTVIIGHMGESSYPVCLEYRYGVDEAKMTKDDWINAWGVVTGVYEYEDANGNQASCPRVEVVYWNSEQEGL